MNQEQAKAQLIEFLRNFPQLDEETLLALADMIPVIAPKKGTVLLKEGEKQKECYYVLQGLVREYQFLDGTERTTAFYSEANGTVSSVHYGDQSPSKIYLTCMEDCLLIAGNLELDESHFKQFPVLLEITKQMLENDLNKAKDQYSNFILSSPKDRYLQFMESRPELMNRVSLQQIASYLGMTPESSSRIRKRIVSPSN